MPIEWQRQEPGWYTSAIGGIVCEFNEWWFYPVADNSPKYGPFRTLAAAKAAADEPAKFLTQQNGDKK